MGFFSCDVDTGVVCWEVRREEVVVVEEGDEMGWWRGERRMGKKGDGEGVVFVVVVVEGEEGDRRWGRGVG